MTDPKLEQQTRPTGEDAMSSEHVEVLRDLSEVCRAAIKAGDWKVDGACDPDAVLRRADSAIAALSAPQSGDWVLVPREPTPEMLSAAGRLQACECGFVGDMSPMDGEEYAAMLAAAPQPPAEAQQQGGWDLKEVACLACGDHIMPMGQVCHACSHPVSATPSADVGVEGVRREIQNALRELDAVMTAEDNTSDAVGCAELALQRALEALALTGTTCKCAQQPAAVDEAMVERFCGRWFQLTGRSLDRPSVRACLTEALAAQHGGRSDD